MGIRFAAVLLCLLLLPALAQAGDYGPRGDVNRVRSGARRLLAHRVRVSGVDPASVKITDVVVVQDQALLSWDSGKTRGVMGLVRYLDRWWDALDKSVSPPNSACWDSTEAFPLTGKDASFDPPVSNVLLTDGLSPQLVAIAARENALVRSANAAATPPPHGNTLIKAGCEDDIYDTRVQLRLVPAGSDLHPDRSQTSGYDLRLSYAKNDAAAGVTFTQVYGRAPTAGEMLPDPPPPAAWGGSNGVFLFDLMLDGSKPVTFAAGSKADVWFPFVLDDSLRYRLSFFTNGAMSPTLTGTVFDNVVHFDLPAFTMPPGDQLMAEIDGWW